MKATVEKLKKNHVALEVEIDEKQVDRAINRAYRKLVKQVVVPGFRKGKVPRRILEMRIGKEVLYNKAMEELLPQAYRAAVEETKIEPIDRPRIDILQLEEGKPFRFKAEVEVKPEARLGQYKGLEVTKQVERVTNEDVNRVLEDMRERHAELVTVEKRIVEKGDFAVIDFEGFIDGKPFPGGAAQHYTLEIGSQQFLPGFGEQLIGAQVGQEVEVNLTFPQEYFRTELAGKHVLFKVKIRELKQKRYPVLDDDFARDVGEFETLLQLRAHIRQRLEEAAEQLAEQRMEADLVDKLIEEAEIELSETMINNWIDAYLEQMEQELQAQNMDLDTYLERFRGETRDEARKRLRSRAEQEVLTSLVLEAVAAEEGITVSDEEMKERMEKAAADHPRPDVVRRQWQSRWEDIRKSLAREKALELVKKEARVNQVVVDKPEAPSTPTAETAPTAATGREADATPTTAASDKEAGDEVNAGNEAN